MQWGSVHAKWRKKETAAGRFYFYLSGKQRIFRAGRRTGMIKIGMMLGERYEILEKIGTGGMSDVYKAKCHKLNRYVAVKVLKQEFSENSNFVSKFRVEAQAAASLMHPNIVNVYDVGEDNGIHYIVMELVEGITLKNISRKSTSFRKRSSQYSHSGVYGHRGRP